MLQNPAKIPNPQILLVKTRDESLSFFGRPFNRNPKPPKTLTSENLLEL